MPDTAARFYFDFVDPLSYLVELALCDIEAATGIRLERIGCELRPPPLPLTRPSDAHLERALGGRPAGSAPGAARAAAARAVDAKSARAARVRAKPGGRRRRAPRDLRGLLPAGRDIGRVDELVDIGFAAGLDRTETKAGLDVDAHLDRGPRGPQRRARSSASGDLPALLLDGRLVQGFHNLTDLSTLLGGSPRRGR
jgi:2-hydroxychromene-2-carboxylate isomerase